MVIDLQLFTEALRHLERLLPPQWGLDAPGSGPYRKDSSDIIDLRLAIHSPQGVYNELFVELRTRVTPLDARQLVAERQRGVRWARGGEAALLVVTPWLSRSVQQILQEGEVAYLDLTGNVFLQLSNPAVFVRTDGATRDPNPSPADERRALSGPKAGRLVRLLVDAAPPVRPADLARRGELSPPYVTRLLATLEDQGLVRRGRRGVEAVDWQALLRARAEQVPALLRPGQALTLLAPRGLDRLQQEIRSHLPDQALVTGSYAAAAITPVAVGGQLLLYPIGWAIGNPGTLAVRLEELCGLLPTDRGADVAVLTPPDPVAVRWGAQQVGGLWYVAPSQVVLDCLTGSGRMPAEGEAVLERMARTEEQWRARSLDDLTGRYFRGQAPPSVESPPSGSPVAPPSSELEI